MKSVMRSSTSSRAFKAAPVRIATRPSRVIAQANKDPVCESYARALAELAQEKGKLEAVHADIDSVASLMAQNPELRALLFNPTVPDESKNAVFEKLGQDAGFCVYTSNFMKVLVNKDRVSQLEQICEDFETLYCEMTDTQVAVVRSAVRMEQEQQFQVAKKLQELTASKNIKLKPILDESLIAGFVVEYGSTQIDMSVKGQIDKYGEQLAKSVLTTFA